MGHHVFRLALSIPVLAVMLLTFSGCGSYPKMKHFDPDKTVVLDAETPAKGQAAPVSCELGADEVVWMAIDPFGEKIVASRAVKHGRLVVKVDGERRAPVFPVVQAVWHNGQEVATDTVVWKAAWSREDNRSTILQVGVARGSPEGTYRILFRCVNERNETRMPWYELVLDGNEASLTTRMSGRGVPVSIELDADALTTPFAGTSPGTPR